MPITLASLEEATLRQAQLITQAQKQAASGGKPKGVIVVTVGPSGAGKTTVSEANVAANPRMLLHITKDQIRKMCHAGVHDRQLEKEVLDIRDLLVRFALDRDKVAIVDDTNLAGTHLRRLRSTFGKRAVVVVDDQYMSVPLEECLRRNAERDPATRLPEKVIRDQFATFINAADHKPQRTMRMFDTRPEAPAFVEGATEAIIVDLDGTLARMNGRSPFEFEKVGSDLCVEDVAEDVRMHAAAGRTIIVMSGRDDSCFKESSDWLKAYGIPHDQLIMRATGDHRSDDIIKEELYREHVEGKYNVVRVIDDRLRVCQMWYRLGLPLRRVGDPDSNF